MEQRDETDPQKRLTRAVGGIFSFAIFRWFRSAS
jgi:hypothetical protein